MKVRIIYYFNNRLIDKPTVAWDNFTWIIWRPSSFYSPCFRTLFFSFRSWTIFFSGSRVSVSKGLGPELPKTYFNIKTTKETEITTTVRSIVAKCRTTGRQPLTRWPASTSALKHVSTAHIYVTDRHLAASTNQRRVQWEPRLVFK